MNDSRRLLAEYAKDGSERAFSELVARYLNLVYSAALRLVDGDAHLAEDVAQTVFADLARTARTLSEDVMLGGWLHRHTCFVAANTMRSDRRRRIRERQAVEMNALENLSETNLSQIRSTLDEAINQLQAEDRAAILLRFFEQRDFRSVGEALGSNEDAARMRVNRALEKLHALLNRQGSVLPVAALGTVLANQVVTAAPIGLAASISSAALASATAASGAALTFAKITTMTKIKSGIIGAVALASVTAPLVIHQQSRLQDQDETLQRQNIQLSQLTADNHRLLNTVAQTKAPPTEGEQEDLRKLRGELANLRARETEFSTAARHETALRQEVAGLQAELTKLKTESIQGRFRPRTDWGDKGNGDPFSAVETMLWASAQGERSRLGAVATSEAVAETRWPIFPSEQPPIQTVGAVNLISSFQDQEGTRAVITAFVREDFAAPPGGSSYSVNKLKGWQLKKDAEGWKVAKTLFFDLGRN